MRKLFLALFLAIVVIGTASAPVVNAAPEMGGGAGSSGGGSDDCVIPPSGPWPPCATGGDSGSSGDCVIPPSGPWPPCATGGDSGGSGDCVIPPSGPWPPCATGGDSGGSDDCVIPPSGPWPPCATGGNSGGGSGDCVIPPSGPWPPCATGGNGGGSGGGGSSDGGDVNPDTLSVEAFVARCGVLEYDLQVFTQQDVENLAAGAGISMEEAYDFLVMVEVVEIPGAQGPTKAWDSTCWAFSAAVMRNAAESMGGLLDRVVAGNAESCGEWLSLNRFVELSPAYSGVPAQYQDAHNKYLAARNQIEAGARDVAKFCLEGGILSDFNFFRAREAIQQALTILNPVTESDAWLAAFLGIN